MELVEFEIKGLALIIPKIFRDERGYFFESYNKEKLDEFLGISVDLVQDNESMSNKNVLRGLHFQEPPHEQAKLVRVIRGSVTDVCVDIRSNSSTYGESIKIDLNAVNQHVLYIPAGFAHGFVSREDKTIFSYKCSGFYNKDSENSIRWNDPDLNIDWQVTDPIVSTKDQVAGSFKQLISLF